MHFFSELCPFLDLTIFILYQASNSRVFAPACGALVNYLALRTVEHVVLQQLFVSNTGKQKCMLKTGDCVVKHPGQYTTGLGMVVCIIFLVSLLVFYHMILGF